MNHTVTLNTYKSDAELARQKEFYGIISNEDFNTYECKRKRQPWTTVEYRNRKERNKNKGGK